MEPINVAKMLSSLDTHWDPNIIAEVNGRHCRLVTLEGEFIWHAHADADERFLRDRGRERRGAEAGALAPSIGAK